MLYLSSTAPSQFLKYGHRGDAMMPGLELNLKAGIGEPYCSVFKPKQS
jgi:hypothetical protein